MVGGHQMRRKGQSLEFYAFRPYVPGDDIRHVDWRASARHGSANDLLVKTFVAEEQLSLVISLDTRPSMSLPPVMPKSLIAAWLAEATAWITLRSADKVVLHRLFGKNGGGIRELSGTAGSTALHHVLKQFYQQDTPGDTLNIEVLDRYLKPAVVWMIISDFYFDMEDHGQRLASRIAQAQDGMRWIILVDTDSWPYEKLSLGLGARKILGPDAPNVDHPFEIDAQAIFQVENRIASHKGFFRDQANRGARDYIYWPWPEEDEPDAAAFFQDQFGKDRLLQRLFMKEHSW